MIAFKTRITDFTKSLIGKNNSPGVSMRKESMSPMKKSADYDAKLSGNTTPKATLTRRTLRKIGTVGQIDLDGTPTTKQQFMELRSHFIARPVNKVTLEVMQRTREKMQAIMGPKFEDKREDFRRRSVYLYPKPSTVPLPSLFAAKSSRRIMRKRSSMEITELSRSNSPISSPHSSGPLIRRSSTIAILDSSKFDTFDAVAKLRAKGRFTRRKSLRKDDSLKAIENRLKFLQSQFLVKFMDYSPDVKRRLKAIYEALIMQRTELEDIQNKKAQMFEDFREKKIPRGFGPWDLLWEYKAEKMKKLSPYADFSSLRIRQLIVKGGDDLRQEMVAMQVIRKIKEFFQREGVPLSVYTYDIVAIDSTCGALEFIHDSISIDGLKKKYPGCTLRDIYEFIWDENFEEAQKKFIESLAAYSVIMYTMQIKDR